MLTLIHADTRPEICSCQPCSSRSRSRVKKKRLFCQSMSQQTNVVGPLEEEEKRDIAMRSALIFNDDRSILFFWTERERERKKNVVTFQYNSKLIFSMSCLNEFDDAFVVYLTIDFAVRSKVKSMSRLKEKGHWRRETPLRRVRPCRRRSSDSSRSTPNIRCRHRRASVALDFEPLFPSPVSNSARRDSTKFADPSEDPFAFQREQSESSDSNDVHGITNKWWHFETTED